MGHEILHTVKETLILLPFLFVCYLLIELVESWTSKRTTRKLKGNKFQVLIGASLGLVPQCGFGVIATDLFSRKKLYMGSLIAIFIATSDEAVPVILSHPDKISSLLPLLITKFVFALLAGYVVYFIERRIEKKRTALITSNLQNDSAEKDEKQNETDQDNHSHNNHEENEEIETIHIGCCGHEIEETDEKTTTVKQRLKHYLIHPLLHTLYIFAFILAVNIAFTAIIYSVGESELVSFLSKAKPLTPLLATIIGLIPNCAASVVLTNMYLIGSLHFGAMLSGLIVNAGISMLVLFKQNKNQKQNLTIIGVCVLTALIAGYSLLYVI